MVLAIAPWSLANAPEEQVAEVVDLVRITLARRNPGESPTTTAARHQLERWLSLGTTGTLVARQLDTRRVEGVLVFRGEGKAVRILHLGAREGRRGTGSQLLRMLQQLRTTQGWTSIRAAVSPQDEAQRAFFVEKHAFREKEGALSVIGGVRHLEVERVFPDAPGEPARREPIGDPSRSGAFAKPVVPAADGSRSGAFAKPAVPAADGSRSGAFAKPAVPAADGSRSGAFAKPSVPAADPSLSGAFAKAAVPASKEPEAEGKGARKSLLFRQPPPAPAKEPPARKSGERPHAIHAIEKFAEAGVPTIDEDEEVFLESAPWRIEEERERAVLDPFGATPDPDDPDVASGGQGADDAAVGEETIADGVDLVEKGPEVAARERVLGHLETLRRRVSELWTESGSDPSALHEVDLLLETTREEILRDMAAYEGTVMHRSEVDMRLAAAEKSKRLLQKKLEAAIHERITLEERAHKIQLDLEQKLNKEQSLRRTLESRLQLESKARASLTTKLQSRATGSFGSADEADGAAAAAPSESGGSQGIARAKPASADASMAEEAAPAPPVAAKPAAPAAPAKGGEAAGEKAAPAKGATSPAKSGTFRFPPGIGPQTPRAAQKGMTQRFGSVGSGGDGPAAAKKDRSPIVQTDAWITEKSKDQLIDDVFGG